MASFDEFPPLMTGETPSFANLTMASRLPTVIRAVGSTNSAMYSLDILHDIEKFAEEVKSGAHLRTPRHLQPESNPFDLEWQRVYDAYGQAGWLNMPWFAAEAYMYHCLLDITHYYDQASPHFQYDPFLPQKEEELHKPSTWSLIRAALQASHSSSLTEHQALSALLRFAIYGNKADLCYKKVASSMSSSESATSSSSSTSSMSFDDSLLLVNDNTRVVSHILSGCQLAFDSTSAADSESLSSSASSSSDSSSSSATAMSAPVSKRFAVIADNSGAELLADLVLIDHLLHHRAMHVVVDLFVKQHPTFVSDATPSDVQHTIRHLVTAFDSQDPCHELGVRLQRALQQQQLTVIPHEYFNGPCFFDDRMPSQLLMLLQPSALIFIKGDANYRRILLDHRWPTSTRFDDVVDAYSAFRACPLVSLRTCKSDPIVGVSAEIAAALDGSDPDWRVNGVRGVLQAHLPTASSSSHVASP